MRGFATTLRYLSDLEASVPRRSLRRLSRARLSTRHLCLCVDGVLLHPYMRACTCCTCAWMIGKHRSVRHNRFRGTIPGLESPKTLCVWHVNEKFRELKAGLAGRPVRKTDDSVLAIIVRCAIRGSNGAAWLRGMHDRVDALGKLGLIVRWMGYFSFPFFRRYSVRKRCVEWCVELYIWKFSSSDDELRSLDNSFKTSWNAN